MALASAPQDLEGNKGNLPLVQGPESLKPWVQQPIALDTCWSCFSLLYLLPFFSSARLARNASLLPDVGVRTEGRQKPDEMDHQRMGPLFLIGHTAHK